MNSLDPGTYPNLWSPQNINIIVAKISKYIVFCFGGGVASGVRAVIIWEAKWDLLSTTPQIGYDSKMKISSTVWKEW